MPAGAGLGAAPASGRARAPPAGPSPAAAEASGSNLVSAPAQPGLHAELRPRGRHTPTENARRRPRPLSFSSISLGLGRGPLSFKLTNRLPTSSQVCAGPASYPIPSLDLPGLRALTLSGPSPRFSQGRLRPLAAAMLAPAEHASYRCLVLWLLRPRAPAEGFPFLLVTYGKGPAVPWGDRKAGLGSCLLQD